MPVSRRCRPLLVGESNPYGSDPYFALYPAPDGCSGHRLCCLILGMRRTDYLREFGRVNLCDGGWDRKEARRRALELSRTCRGPLVLLGSKVTGSFGFKFEPFVALVDRDLTLLMLPHPSGLCRTWNQDGAFTKARAMVAEVCLWIAPLLGVVQ